MRNTHKLLLFLLLLAIYACGGDDTPAVIPTVEFTHERQIVETGDEVAFVSNHTDADTFLWEFGDGVASTQENPTHTYTTTGEFTVSLTVTSSTGDTANSTSTVTVGSRWIAGFSINSINDVDQDGNPWDDNDGPELLFGYAPARSESISLFNLGENLTSSDFPVGGTLEVADQEEFTDENWDFIFIDNDEPLEEIDLSTDDLMTLITFNPLEQEPEEKDFTTGQAIFTIAVQDFNFTVLYQIRN